MPARSRARKRALDILYESEMRGLSLGATLSHRMAMAEQPLNEYTVALVEGVIAHHDRIDELISTYSQGWTLERMPAVDRNVLRIGVYEVMYRDDVPDPVALDEAVSLARELSTEQSPTFVNGLLGRLVAVKPSLTL
ncbi:transcription antitermination factor NusB [Jiangella asiatica]|uniref:Transcription antitermination protein NusB n=1 Tax=Jiangella asiatica TaxID=2530372 RepID=A0A4R5DJW7_9ACTN|nr:transcription antitermination factor NusB [Jiangella asiatica]TDE12261.1 transcription antitermination factor NusB [Jiangella asiatica]